MFEVDDEQIKIVRSIKSFGDTVNTMIHNDHDKDKEVSTNINSKENKKKNKGGNKLKTPKTHKDVTSTRVITYTIKRIVKTRMLGGKEKVMQKCVNGSTQIVSRIYYTNNVETGREQLFN